MIWTRSPTNFDSWEAELQFRVTGRGRIGADGLAFWYTATKGFEGPVSTLYIFGTTMVHELCSIKISNHTRL